ncbi:MAG: hypothetical protein Edafosvirus14_3 [Edafosvirus sp.]|uniref:Uncharacterized protein n=1 Tax=Edafosvirus sp. TaxID=2487765 RepID=A0A3G4ZU73_9VIRU|nr:MAG: hypothetical protein Edafosvirus14_3 [Edafosvirus sp.]
MNCFSQKIIRTISRSMKVRNFSTTSLNAIKNTPKHNFTSLDIALGSVTSVAGGMTMLAVTNLNNPTPTFYDESQNEQNYGAIEYN